MKRENEKKPPLLFTSVFFLLACQISEEERIHQMLIRREEAWRKKDLSLYLSCIFKAYQDREEDFSQLPKKKNRYSDKEAFSLKKEGKGWKIIKGL